jgi:rubrerythrin
LPWETVDRGGKKMADFKCSKCGFEKEAKCKPQKCPNCGEKKSFEKK